MQFRIVDIHAAADISVRAPHACVIIPSKETVTLSKDEIGFLEGKRSHHRKGVFMQGGILNPGWSGQLSIELLLFGEVAIKEGDEIAHAIIFTGENINGYTFTE